MTDKKSADKKIASSNGKDNKKKKKKPRSRLPYIIIFIVGLMILLYPQVSRIYYKVESSKQIQQFEQGKSQMSDKDKKRRIELAKAYNRSLVNSVSDDPYDDKKMKEGRAEYARMLEIHEQIGHIQIPNINTDIPIYAGTAEVVLQKGAGHLEGTSLPIGGANTHTVITAHSGLPTARLFTDLNKLKVGDKFYIHNLDNILAYEVDQIKTVLPSQFDDLLVVPGKDYATLLTCTPIMINSHRLLVRGHRVEYDESMRQAMTDSGKLNLILKLVFILDILLILILIWRNIHYIRMMRRYLRGVKSVKKRLGIDMKMGGENDDRGK